MRFIDRYFYAPNTAQKLLSIVLLPLSLLYLIASILRRKCAKYYDFNIPIISIGNLVAGGSGKTPFIIEIAKKYEHIAIISRGYKRKSKGLVIVSINGKLEATQEQSGDEAYLIAKSLKNASVIVCKDRKKAILEAKKLGAKIIFLDDGFRFNFKKLNIILKPKLRPYFRLPIPSGIYRENPFYKPKKDDLILQEGIEYKREVNIENPTDRMLLLTAIANPTRLDEFLPENVIGKILLQDHATFNLDEIRTKAKELDATSLLVTSKDEVKLQNCDMPLSRLVLRLNIESSVKNKIKEYIES